MLCLSLYYAIIFSFSFEGSLLWSLKNDLLRCIVSAMAPAIIILIVFSIFELTLRTNFPFSFSGKLHLANQNPKIAKSDCNTTLDFQWNENCKLSDGSENAGEGRQKLWCDYRHVAGAGALGASAPPKFFPCGD